MSLHLKSHHYRPLLLGAVIILSFTLRSIGVNWDASTHLNPDERFVTLVTTSLSRPASLSQFLDPHTSPANPHNTGNPYYVYGTLPVFAVKLVSLLFSSASYDATTLVGRHLSAFLDTLTTLLVFGLAYQLYRSFRLALLSSLAYALSVLPIQLAHFYTVDPWLVFFATLTLFLLLRSFRPLPALLAGLALGCALASKIQAFVVLPLVACLLLSHLRHTSFRRWLFALLCFGLAAFFSLRFGQPYLFASSQLFDLHPNPKVLENWTQLRHWYSAATYEEVTPGVSFPPASMFIKTPPTFVANNLLLWGLGVPLSLFLFVGLLRLGFLAIKSSPRHHFIPALFVLWASGVFLYQSLLFAKYMRYLGIIYPVLAFLSALGLEYLLTRLKWKPIQLILLLSLFLWPLAFVRIYTQTHPRVAASQWIYSHLSSTSRVTFEHWDDPLPLCLPGSPCPLVTQLELPLYDPDTPQKWSRIVDTLTQADYIIESSNRLYGSIAWLPDRYPITSRYYSLLFSGQLGFVPIQHFVNRPSLPFPLPICLRLPDSNYGYLASRLQTCSNPGLHLVDDYADESFTVYDHPQVIIFQKVTPVNYPAVLGLPL